jgi:HSP20 family protein
MFNMMMPYRKNNALKNRETYLNPFSDDFFRSFFDMDAFEGALRVDVKDEGDHYLMEADMPGVKKDDIHVDVDGGVLTISTEYDESKDDKKDDYVCRERRWGGACRSFNVEGVKEEDIKAEFKDGVLRLTLPKQTEQPKETGRHIRVA